ncbi:GNAT family N-acetyltransferase [Demequina zhanjiangensis]|uniref:GNAT family N-acetyltransferase n=1 Tax=Demequina zhanjiangensis TaxID=3051659 RepID=A0ABT8G090_9MICO|nr:GNAT family N-acetyltransferase [Demequina sp. SYSU T00b26]MDN4472432.1 GNAT family N-acetyltransferase [Demequina sp. SYSU T00b26]
MSNTTDAHTTTDSIQVTRSDESGRYELHVDGALAGVAEFVDQDEQTVFTHTEVYDDYQGRGLGSTLVGEAVRDAVARDRVIVPQCPYTARWLSTHEVPGARIAQP